MSTIARTGLCAEFMDHSPSIRAFLLVCRDFMAGGEGSDCGCREVLERQEISPQQIWTLRGAKKEWGCHLRSCGVLRGSSEVMLQFPPSSLVANSSEFAFAHRLSVRVTCPLPEGACVVISTQKAQARPTGNVKGEKL